MTTTASVDRPKHTSSSPVDKCDCGGRSSFFPGTLVWALDHTKNPGCPSAPSPTKVSYPCTSGGLSPPAMLFPNKVAGLQQFPHPPLLAAATVKMKTVNGEVQLQALVDGKKIIVTEASVRRDLQLNDEEGTDCLPNANIFEELTRMGAKTTAWNEFSNIMASAIICLATNQKFNFSKYIFESMVKNLENVSSKFLMYPRFVQVFLDKQLEGKSSHKRIYVTPFHTKKIIRNIKRVGKGFSRRDTPLFPTIMVQAQQEQGEDEAVNEKMDGNLVRAATTTTGLDAKQDSSNIDKTQSKATPNEPSSLGTSSGVNTPRSDKDRLKLNELMEFYTKLQQRVLDLENTKTAKAQEITSLKLRVKKLEKKGGSRTHKLKRLYKVGRSARVISSDEASLGRYGDEEMFDTDVLKTLKSAKVQEKVNVVEDPSESITTTPTLTTTTAATTITVVSTRPKAKGLVIHKEEQATVPIVSSQQPSQVKAQNKGKGIMVEEHVKMKKKDQISLDEELAFKLQAEEEEERLAREKAQREEEANIVSWDNVQAMIDADYQMAQQMQAEEQEKLSIEEKSKLFVQLLEARKKHFAAMRAQEKRNKPPTKAQKRNTMSTYLKNMAGYKHNQLKNKSFDDIQKLFDKAMKRVNTFVDMDTELVEGSEVRAEAEIAQESSSKRAGTELEQESIKKQKVDEDKETTELQRLIEVVPDKEEVAIDDIPLAVKSPSIVDYKIYKEGKKSFFQIIRADVKARFKKTEPVNYMDNFLLLNLKTMFEHHVEDNV
ncbi:hypothetical protein Tco_0304091 [Tanacetum coccineum]